MDSPFRKFAESDISTENQKQEIKDEEQRYEQDKDTTQKSETYHIENVESDKGKLAEMKGVEFFNERLGKYVSDVDEQEKKVAELENKNWYTKATAWIEKNDIARRIKILGKTIGGATALTAGIIGTGGFLAPALLSLGGKAVVDGAIEFYQYTQGGESRLRQELRDAQISRTAQIIELMKMRKQIQNEDSNTPITGETMINSEALKDSLKRIVDETENQERIIIEKQQEIAKLTEKFAKIRFAAGIATTAATIGYSAIYGINFGMQNFDAGTKGAEYLKDLYGGVASSSHQVKLYSDGFHFMYNNAEHMANQGMASLTEGRHLIDPLNNMFNSSQLSGYTHKLAGTVPWWKLWSSVAGMLGTMGASTYHEYERMQNSKSQKEKVESSLKPVFFSLLKDPKTTYGDIKSEFTTLQANVLGEGSVGKKADLLAKFNQELRPDQIIISKGEITNTGPTPTDKDIRYMFIKKEGDKIFLAEINKRGKEVQRVVISDEELYNRIEVKKYVRKTSEINTTSETSSSATKEDAKWYERNNISAGNKIEIGTGVDLEDEDGNIIPADIYEIESANIPSDEIVIVKKEKVVNKGTKTEKYVITSEKLNTAMKANPGSIATYEVKKKESDENKKESNWNNLLDELVDGGKFGEEAKKKVNNRSIFKFEGDVKDSSGNDIAGFNFVITGVTNDKVHLAVVNSNDKIQTGPANRGTADKADFITDCEYQWVQAKK